MKAMAPVMATCPSRLNQPARTTQPINAAAVDRLSRWGCCKACDHLVSCILGLELPSAPMLGVEPGCIPAEGLQHICTAGAACAFSARVKRQRQYVGLMRQDAPLSLPLPWEARITGRRWMLASLHAFSVVVNNDTARPSPAHLSRRLPLPFIFLTTS